MSSFLTLLLATPAFAGILNFRQASSSGGASSTAVPDYFQTVPEFFPGPTATGTAPFLAEASQQWASTYYPPAPLQTHVPISGNTNNSNIFQLVGQLSPYFPSPGFGNNEYPLPPDANITQVSGCLTTQLTLCNHANALQVHVLHRHGARYPTGDSSVASFGSKLVVSVQLSISSDPGIIGLVQKRAFVMDLR